MIELSEEQFEQLQAQANELMDKRESANKFFVDALIEMGWTKSHILKKDPNLKWRHYASFAAWQSPCKRHKLLADDLHTVYTFAKFLQENRERAANYELQP